jgi:hypothetical protein
MVIIRFHNRSEWFKANWVFRQIASDVTLMAPDDVELKSIMDKAQAFGLLAFDSMEKNAATRTLDALRKVAELTLAGKIRGWHGASQGNDNEQRKYLDSLTELLSLMKSVH